MRVHARRYVTACLALAALLTSVTASTSIALASDAPTAATPPRIEAHSAHLLAVGIVRDDRLNIHVARILDNAPLTDAAVTVLLRGTVHPTTAEADGGYGMQSEDLRVPGSATIVFQVSQRGTREDLQGTLQIGMNDGKREDKNSARQLGWWVLNFAVCIGFLMLLSRRRKAAARDST